MTDARITGNELGGSERLQRKAAVRRRGYQWVPTKALGDRAGGEEETTSLPSTTPLRPRSRPKGSSLDLTPTLLSIYDDIASGTANAQMEGERHGQGQGAEEAKAKSRSLPSSARHGLAAVGLDARGTLALHRRSLEEDPSADSKKRPLSISSVSSASSSSLSRHQSKRPNLDDFDRSPRPAARPCTLPADPVATETPLKAAGVEYRLQEVPRGGGGPRGEGGGARQSPSGAAGPAPPSPRQCVQCSSDGGLLASPAVVPFSQDVNQNSKMAPDQNRRQPLRSPSQPSPSGQGGSAVPTPSPGSDTTTTSSSANSTLTRSPESRGPSGKARPPSAGSPEGGGKVYVSYVERVVSEIVDTEAKYVRSLEEIITGYLEFLESTLFPEMTPYLTCLFSNIRDIYHFSRSFLRELEACKGDPVQVAECFVRNNKGFVIYTDYCTNYPSAVEVLTKFMKDSALSEVFRNRQLVLGHGLPLGAYLLRPVQRILKYHLLLQNILKNFEKNQPGHSSLEQALQHMTSMAQHINEMKRKHEHAVRIQEIQSQLDDYGGEDLTRLGELVLEGTFRVYGARASRHVFLFERGLLICKKKEGSMLSCKSLIPCSNLMLVEVIPNEPLSFNIIPFDNPRNQYTLQARNTEQKRRWCQEVKRLILESYSGKIPDKVKSLVMELGRGHEEDVLGYEGPKKHQKAPEYLERRRVRRKSGGKLPDLLKPQRAQKKANKKADAVSPRTSPQPVRRALSLEYPEQVSSREEKALGAGAQLFDKSQAVGNGDVIQPTVHHTLSSQSSSSVVTRSLADLEDEPMETEKGESRLSAGGANDVRRAESFRRATRLQPINSADLSDLPLTAAPAPAAGGSDSDADDPNIIKDGLKEYTDYLFDSRSDLDLDSDLEEGSGARTWKNGRSVSQGSLSGVSLGIGRSRSSGHISENGAGRVKTTQDRQVNSWLNRQDDSRTKPPSGECKVMAFHDTFTTRRVAQKLKLRSMEGRMSNATKHLSLPNELRKGPKSGAKLTDWSSVDKLTKGSLTDLSHLEEDPWVLNPELVNKTASVSSLSSGGSAGLRPRASSEVREVSLTSQDSLDWMVYVNRNDQDSRLLGHQAVLPHKTRSPGKNVSPYSTSSRGSLASLSGRVDSVYDPLPADVVLSESPPSVPSINVTTSHLPGHARSQSSAGQLPSPPPQPTHHRHHTPQTPKSTPQWRRSLQSPPHPSVYRRRTASVDNPGSVDIIQESARMVAEMEDYMKNSSASLSNHARFPTNLSPTMPSGANTDVNRLSSGSSVSTSSYDSGSSEGRPDVPPTFLGDDVDSPSVTSSEVSSRRERSRSGSYDVTLPSTPQTPEGSLSDGSQKGSSESGTPTQVASPSVDSPAFSLGKDHFHASSPNLSPPPESGRDPQTKDCFQKASSPARSSSMLKLSPRTDVLTNHCKVILSPLPSPVGKAEEREKRELQSVLRSRELGSSAIGSRMAQNVSAPPPSSDPPLSPSQSSDSSPLSPHCGSNSSRLSRPCSACVDQPTPTQKSAYDYLAKEASPDSPARFSLPLPAQAPKPLTPDQPASLQQSDSGFSMQSDVTDSVGEETPVTQSPSISPRDMEPPSSDEGAAAERQTKHRNSNSSVGSVDSFYERRLSEALEPGTFRDSAVFCDLDAGSKSPSVCEEPIPRRSIREFVQVLEERSKQRAPRPIEVKRRPPGRIIQQRLQTLVQAAQYRSPREGSLTRLPSEEREQPSRSIRDIQASLVHKNQSGPEPTSAGTVCANQFVHRRPRFASAQSSSGSALMRSSSNVGSRPNSMCGTMRPARSLGRLDQLSSEGESTVIMKGWVQQLISRFQMDSSKENSPSPEGMSTTTTDSLELAL